MADRPSYKPTLKAMDASEVPVQTRNGGESLAMQTINEFLDSGADAAEVENGAKSFPSSLKRAIKGNAERGQAPIEGVAAFRRGERTFLRRVGPGETMEADDSE